MGRGNRAANTATAQRASTSQSHSTFTKSGLELAQSAITQGDEARFRQAARDGRYDSQKAENAFLRSLPDRFEHNGSEARLITSMPEIGWRRSNARYWIDFAIEHEDVLYPYNFKFGQGDSSDNVGSFGTLAYLLGGKIEHPLKPAMLDSRNDLAHLVSDVLAGKTPEDPYPLREYFCLHYNASAEDASYQERFRTLAISQLREQDMIWNPSNGLQVNFTTAEHVAPQRSRQEARRTIAEGTYSLFRKLANPLQEIENNMSAAELKRLNKKLDS